MNRLLGEQLRNLREAKKFSQEQVAEVLGMSRQKYARIESGVNDVTLEVLSKAARLFDVTVGDITKVLDKEVVVAYRRGEGEQETINTVYEMLDLFYANKHAYERVHGKWAE